MIIYPHGLMLDLVKNYKSCTQKRKRRLETLPVGNPFNLSRNERLVTISIGEAFLVLFLILALTYFHGNSSMVSLAILNLAYPTYALISVYQEKESPN